MPALTLDQKITDALTAGQADTHHVRLDGGLQYRIDIHGADPGEGTLAAAPALTIYAQGDRHPFTGAEQWRPVAVSGTVPQPTGVFYFTPFGTGTYDLVVSAPGAGTYSMVVHAPTRSQAIVEAEGFAGSHLVASDGDDLIQLGQFGFSPSYSSSRPTNTLDAGAGFDTVAMARYYNWTVKVVDGTVTFLGGYNPSYGISAIPKGMDDVMSTVVASGVEAVEAATGILYTLRGERAHVVRLYQAALDRMPDVDGAAHHVGRYDGGTALEEIARGFMQSPEFQAKYGALSPAAFVTQLYQNVLHRAPAADEVDFYVTQMAQGGMTPEAVLIGFAASPENVALTSNYILPMG